MRRSPLAMCLLLAAGCADYGTDPQARTNPQFDHTTVGPPPATINVNNYAAAFHESGLETFYKGSGALFNGGLSYGTGAEIVHYVNTSNGYFDVAQTGFPVQVSQPGSLADHYSSTVMAEQPSQALGLKNELGIVTVRETFAFSDAPDDDYLIVKYSLTNTTSSPISNLHVGYLADPDMDDPATPVHDVLANIAYFHGASQSARVRTNVGPVEHAIITLSHPVGTYRSWRQGGAAFPDRDPDTNAGWYSLLSGGIFSSPFGPFDIRQYVGTAATTLAPGETKVYAFALVGGDNATDLSSNIASARTKAGLLTTPVPALAAVVSMVPGTALWTARITFASTAEASLFNASNARCGGAVITSSVQNGANVDVAFGSLELEATRRSGAAMHCGGILGNGTYFAGTDYPTFVENTTPATRLTNAAGLDHSAVWSPAGNKIAFVSARLGGGIFTLDPTGTEVNVTLLHAGAGINQLSWSSTGKIAYTQGPSIFAIPQSGGSPVLLQSNAADPQYSPDGSRIAFRRGAGPTSIMVMNADGSNVMTVTSGNFDFYPEWVGNNKLIFARLNNAQADERIFSIEVGLPTSLTQITPNEPGLVRFPAMSPDEKTLVFTANVGLVLQDMQSGLHTVVRPAPAAHPYTAAGSQAGSEFSPDGTKILYTSGNNTNAEVWFISLPQPATPAERTEQLSAGIESLIADGLVSAADGAQLMDKLSTVADKIAGGQLNAAVNNVNSFINKVNALVNSRRLSQISGQQLTSEANLLITQLQSIQP